MQGKNAVALVVLSSHFERLSSFLSAGFFLLLFSFFSFKIGPKLVRMNETGKQIYHIYLHTNDDVHVLYYLNWVLTRKNAKVFILCIHKQVMSNKKNLN